MTAESSPDLSRPSGVEEADRSSRTPTQRDRDRILYSEAFRRLGAVTQVALGRPELTLHNRLTHSLKVEQVGVALYTKLAAEGQAGQLDVHAIAAACLGHDLGHPPFGHAAEAELNAILTCKKHRDKARTYAKRKASPCTKCKLEDGFEGNAQSFRIVARLASHRGDQPRGLDLTYRSLSAITKYPWLRGENPEKPRKWGAYDCDADILDDVTSRAVQAGWASAPLSPSLEAQVMDWADDISYAVHDIEDFYRSGHIPLSDYKLQSETLKRFYAYASTALGGLKRDVKKAFQNLLSFMPTTAYSGTAADHALLDRARSLMLTQFIDAAAIESGALKRQPIPDALNSLIKQLIWFHVIDGPRLASIQLGQRRIVREIFEALEPVALAAYNAKSGAEPDEQLVRRLPDFLRVSIEATLEKSGETYNKRECVYRGLTDYVASLSDDDAYFQHSVLLGQASHRHL